MGKKRFAVILSFLLLAGILAGCGRGNATPTDPHAGQVEVSDGNGGTMWIDEAENIPVFGMDASNFSVLNGDVSYSGDGYTLRRGIDVSSYQGDVDWSAVAASGVQFAMIRCGWRGYSGGTVNEDDHFRQNIEGALAAGLQVGIYFYSQAVNVYEAAEEAVYTVNLIRGYDVTLPVFFDWEHVIADNVRTSGMTGEEVTDCCLEFCRIIQAAGYTSGVYAYLNLAYYTYDLDELADQVLWISDPSSQPDFYYDHAYWQYSCSGSVSGISGDVDLDVMYVKTSYDAQPTQVP